MTYNAPLRRYLWWQQLPQPKGHPDRGDTRFTGSFAIYDALEPWGRGRRLITPRSGMPARVSMGISPQNG